MLENIKNPNAKTVHIVLALVYIVVMVVVMALSLWHYFYNGR